MRILWFRVYGVYRAYRVCRVCSQFIICCVLLGIFFEKFHQASIRIANPRAARHRILNIPACVALFLTQPNQGQLRSRAKYKGAVLQIRAPFGGPFHKGAP